MDITAQSPDQFSQLVKSSYPFHPAIKDLYAHFRENQGFQQTRALIRLMRIIAARLWQNGEADKKHLISVHDIDLNDPETLSEVRQINSGLENAVAHDIASQGTAVAEAMDQNLTGSDARDFPQPVPRRRPDQPTAADITAEARIHRIGKPSLWSANRELAILAFRDTGPNNNRSFWRLPDPLGTPAYE